MMIAHETIPLGFHFATLRLLGMRSSKSSRVRGVKKIRAPTMSAQLAPRIATAMKTKTTICAASDTALCSFPDFQAPFVTNRGEASRKIVHHDGLYDDTNTHEREHREDDGADVMVDR